MPLGDDGIPSVVGKQASVLLIVDVYQITAWVFEVWTYQSKSMIWCSFILVVAQPEHQTKSGEDRHVPTMPISKVTRNILTAHAVPSSGPP